MKPMSLSSTSPSEGNRSSRPSRTTTQTLTLGAQGDDDMHVQRRNIHTRRKTPKNQRRQRLLQGEEDNDDQPTTSTPTPLSWSRFFQNRKNPFSTESDNHSPQQQQLHADDGASYVSLAELEEGRMDAATHHADTNDHDNDDEDDDQSTAYRSMADEDEYNTPRDNHTNHKPSSLTAPSAVPTTRGTPNPNQPQILNNNKRRRRRREGLRASKVDPLLAQQPTSTSTQTTTVRSNESTSTVPTSEPTVTPPTSMPTTLVSSQYRTKFQQFNEPHDHYHNKRRRNASNDDELMERGRANFWRFPRWGRQAPSAGSLGHDLQLHEDEGVTSSTSLPTPSNTDTSTPALTSTPSLRHSNLLFRHPVNGRVCLQLPVDQVRLVMDADLEPGILSVQQWRDPKDEAQIQQMQLAQEEWQETNTMTTDDETRSLTRSASAESYGDRKPRACSLPQTPERPPLNYVLTVSDDLYKQLVAEMSDAVTNPYCGFKRCCSNNEKEEHADIGIAICIMTFTMILLLINTIIWPTT